MTGRVIYEASGKLSANARYECSECDWAQSLEAEGDPLLCPICESAVYIVSDDRIVTVGDCFAFWPFP